jgi:iron complex outermembrane receptor protein
MHYENKVLNYGRSHLLATAALAIILSLPGQASAQAAQPPTATPAPAEGEAPQPAGDTKDIVVTGTSIRGVKPVGSATVSVSGDALKDEGISRPSDLTRVLPQLQTSNIRETSNNGIAANSTRGAAFNLRGLGSTSTLLLLDGHRLVSNGAADTYQDSNIIPLAAVERVEVVTDGASAIYGADAVGGVVNYILKKNYQGLEIRAQYGEQLSSPAWEVSILGGVNYKLGDRPGNILISFRHSRRDPILRSASPFLGNDLRQLGGNDNRITAGSPNVFSGNPGTLAVPTASGTQFYAIPAGNGTGLTAASLTPGLGNIAKDADNYPYLGGELQNSVTAYLNQEVTDHLSVYAEGYFNRRDVHNWGPGTAQFGIAPSSPLFVQGLGATGSETVNYRFPDIDLRTYEETYSITAGARLELPMSWQADLYTTYGDNKNCGNCRYGVPNQAAYTAQLAQGNINPFSSTPLTDDQLAKTVGYDIDSSTSWLSDTSLKLNGPLFSLPAGQVRAAVGAEYTETHAFYTNFNNNSATNTQTRNRPPVTLSRNVKSAFAELYVPVVSGDMNVPLVHSLNISGAVRYDKYSDFGSTTNPKFGLTWEVTEDLSFRGTWGRSFRAPSLQAASAGTIGNSFFIPFFANNSGDPALPKMPANTGFPNNSFVMLLAGGNSHLKPERATTYSFGADYAPKWFDGLRLSATYYHIDFKDRIQGNDPGLFLSSPANYAIYKSFVRPVAQPSTCVDGNVSTYAPAYQQGIAEDPFTVLFANLPSACSAVGILDARTQNIGTVKQDGLDFQFQYEHHFGFGTVQAGTLVTKILTLKQSILPNGPAVNDVLDTIGFPNSLRIRSNVGIVSGGVRAALFLNHIGSYLNNANIQVNGVALPNLKVPGWTTFDLSLGYEFQSKSGLLKGFAVNFNVQNLFDKDPPVVLNGTGAGGAPILAFDEVNANPFGRSFQIELVKKF